MHPRQMPVSIIERTSSDSADCRVLRNFCDNALKPADGLCCTSSKIAEMRSMIPPSKLGKIWCANEKDEKETKKITTVLPYCDACPCFYSLMSHDGGLFYNGYF